MKITWILSEQVNNIVYKSILNTLISLVIAATKRAMYVYIYAIYWFSTHCSALILATTHWMRTVYIPSKSIVGDRRMSMLSFASFLCWSEWMKKKHTKNVDVRIRKIALTYYRIIFNRTFVNEENENSVKFNYVRKLGARMIDQQYCVKWSIQCLIF